MTVMHVADFHIGAFTGKSTGAQCRKTAFMGQFRKGVGLIHELTERTGTEKFFNCRRYRTDVN